MTVGADWRQRPGEFHSRPAWFRSRGFMAAVLSFLLLLFQPSPSRAGGPWAPVIGAAAGEALSMSLPPKKEAFSYRKTAANAGKISAAASRLPILFPFTFPRRDGCTSPSSTNFQFPLTAELHGSP